MSTPSNKNNQSTQEQKLPLTEKTTETAKVEETSPIYQEYLLRAKRTRRIIGEQAYSGPILRDTSARMDKNGRYSDKDLILDSTQIATQLRLSGQDILLDKDCEFTPKDVKEALLTLANIMNPKGSRWHYLMEGSPMQLYEIVNLSEEESKMYAKEMALFEQEKFIHNLKDEEVDNYAVVLGLTNKGPQKTKLQLIKMLRDEKTNGMIKQIISMDPDERAVRVILLSAMKFGLPDAKKGVYKNSIGVYYNDKLLGITIDEAVAYLLTADNRLDIISALKKITAK